MLANELLVVYRQLIDSIEQEQLQMINRVAELAAQSVAAGGSVYIHDRGHLLNYELFHRSGGLALLKHLNMSPVTGEGVQGELDAAAATIPASPIRKGDILILGSVSGRAASVVELARQARDHGIVTVALTAVDYTSQTPSLHPSGKRLFEVCEHVLDIMTLKGDAALEAEGMEEKILPTSGVTSAVVSWCFIAQLIESLLAKGIAPSVYRSVSMPGGMEQIEATNKRFQELGY
ncbi:sugar isomerase domain-containing protein [Paenibacillus spongiae]|uniref:Sugar isomerase domain-containing protein n=1 Tax=Paenibacillus spongiae TaxID=2909671 RepID=A0ABY5S381_9BACL|nr:sugar isomerase domain-containing protein [Paenibacillus spongiae]UVI28366.1 sugar isomerase domain-containing protein [Paenibacillus spongiae]